MRFCLHWEVAPLELDAPPLCRRVSSAWSAARRCCFQVDPPEEDEADGNGSPDVTVAPDELPELVVVALLLVSVVVVVVPLEDAVPLVSAVVVPLEDAVPLVSVVVVPPLEDAVPSVPVVVVVVPPEDEAVPLVPCRAASSACNLARRCCWRAESVEPPEEELPGVVEAEDELEPPDDEVLGVMPARFWSRARVFCAFASCCCSCCRVCELVLTVEPLDELVSVVLPSAVVVGGAQLRWSEVVLVDVSVEVDVSVLVVVPFCRASILACIAATLAWSAVIFCCNLLLPEVEPLDAPEDVPEEEEGDHVPCHPCPDSFCEEGDHVSEPLELDVSACARACCATGTNAMAVLSSNAAITPLRWPDREKEMGSKRCINIPPIPTAIVAAK